MKAELPAGIGQIVLVLQGGGALGAYQVGVYQALHEAGIEPRHVDQPMQQAVERGERRLQLPGDTLRRRGRDIAPAGERRKARREQRRRMDRLAQIMARRGEEACLRPVRGRGPVALAFEALDQGKVLEAQRHRLAQRPIGDEAVVEIDAEQTGGEDEIDRIDRLLLLQAAQHERQLHRDQQAGIGRRIGRERRHRPARHAGQHDADEGDQMRLLGHEADPADHAPEQTRQDREQREAMRPDQGPRRRGTASEIAAGDQEPCAGQRVDRADPGQELLAGHRLAQHIGNRPGNDEIGEQDRARLAKEQVDQPGLHALLSPGRCGRFHHAFTRGLRSGPATTPGGSGARQSPR